MKKCDFEKRIQQLQEIVDRAKGADRKSAEGKAGARAQRKLKCIHAVMDMLSQIPEDATLEESTYEYLTTLGEVYVAGTHIEVNEGDSLIELLEKYSTVKDLYKKILKQCEEKGLQIQGTEIVKK